MANVPEAEAKVRMLNELPLLGVNPLMRAILTVPARAAVPDTFNWSYFVPAVVPPSSTFRVPVDVWV